jgi:hypothetical protein
MICMIWLVMVYFRFFIIIVVGYLHDWCFHFNFVRTNAEFSKKRWDYTATKPLSFVKFEKITYIDLYLLSLPVCDRFFVSNYYLQHFHPYLCSPYLIIIYTLIIISNITTQIHNSVRASRTGLEWVKYVTTQIHNSVRNRLFRIMFVCLCVCVCVIEVN